jgi:hypothetical protein
MKHIWILLCGGSPKVASLQLDWHDFGNGSAAVVVPPCHRGALQSELEGELESSSLDVPIRSDSRSFHYQNLPKALR